MRQALSHWLFMVTSFKTSLFKSTFQQMQSANTACMQETQEHAKRVAHRKSYQQSTTDTQCMHADLSSTLVRVESISLPTVRVLIIDVSSETFNPKSISEYFPMDASCHVAYVTAVNLTH